MSLELAVVHCSLSWLLPLMAKTNEALLGSQVHKHQQSYAEEITLG